MTTVNGIAFQALTWELQNKRPPPFKRKIVTDKVQFEEATQVVHCCGRMENGESVRVAIIGYHPYFYARISESEFDRVVSSFVYKYDTGGARGQKSQRHQFEDWWVVDKCMEDKCIYQGFKNGEKDSVLKITCANQACMRDMIKALTDTPPSGTGQKHYELFDVRQDVLCSFYHETGLKPCGWINIENTLEFEDQTPFAYEESRCDHDYVVRIEDIKPMNDKINMAPFKVCSIDIEAFGPMGDDGRYPFPDPEISSHQTSCICVRKRLLTQGSDEGEYVYFSYKPLDMDRVNELCSTENLSVSHKDSKACNSEKEMFAAFISYCEREKFDIIIGWNTLDFDMRYIYHRCKLYGIDLYRIAKWGTKETCRPLRLEDVTLSTAGAGHNRFRYWNISGVFQMDELVVVRRDKKYDTYKLGAVSNILLGDTKMDEPPSEIHRKSQGTSTELAEIVVYCMKDTKLPDEIACKLQSYMKNFMFANMATVPVTYLLTRGANIKTSSFITKNVRKRGMIISNKNKWFNKIDGKYEGATVLDALKGFYDDPVATLDFKSLYPSIFISQVLDPHMFVESDVFRGIPGVKYKNHKWIDKKSGQRFDYWIVTNGEELGIPAVIPEIMQELWNERDEAKKKMKKAANYTEKSVFDGIQLAVKLLMNSIYGFFGAVNASPIPHLPLAMICTYTGRKFIEESQKFVLARYGNYDDKPEIAAMTLHERMKLELKELECDTVVNVYGDSVSDETPLLLKKDGHIIISTFNEISNEMTWTQSNNGKEFASFDSMQTWTDQGWTDISTIIRHKANKPMFRITCHTGCVTVTSDHSLITANGKEVTPNEINIGEDLLTSWPPIETMSTSNDNMTTEMARILGMFCGDGSCGYYKCPSGYKHTWYICNQDVDMLDQYKVLCEREFDMNFKIIDCMKTDGVFRLVPSGNAYGSIKMIVNQFSEWCYFSDRSKKVPDVVLGASQKVKAAFLGGFYDADGHKTLPSREILNSVGVKLYSQSIAVGTGCKITQKGQASTLGLFALIKALGLNVSVNTRSDKLDIFTLTITKNTQRRSAGFIKKIERVNYDSNRYVYDLTTTNHKFHAGVGQLIVHNTDSIFVKWKVSDEARALGQKAILEENFKQSELAGEEITTWLLENHCPVPKRVEMEFEKVYYSLISYSKKRYIGLLWTNTDKPDYIDYKGVQPVRRDTPKILKSTIQECIKLILIEKKRKEAFDLLEQTFKRIQEGRYDVIEFAKTGAISDKEYVGALPPAAEVATLLKARGLPVAERVEYVYIVGDPKSKASTKVDAPDYIRDNNLKVDTKYYMTNQFRKPILELLGPALENLEDLIDKYTAIFSDEVKEDEQVARRTAHQKELNTKPITSFFKPK